ncbi:ribonuclease HIII [Candidatus Izemoplasma sp. B36]|uniref:ribonuclease HIII n=1 Tax=Candidatus Izemoplasma sp. B36 TaxID=3242468 RepID=UPI003558517A
MNYNLQLDKNLTNKFVSYYNTYLEENKDSRILFSFKSENFKIIIYNSYKVMFQGVNGYKEYEKWAKHLNVDLIKPVDESKYNNQYSNKKIIGSDEVGTGDFFGPIVVCAAYITPKDLEKIKELNIQDSKNLSDKQISILGKELIEVISYHVLVLNNEKYNELTYQGYNMNKIKAYLHNHAIKKMVDKHKSFDYVILDQFCEPRNYFEYLKAEKPFKTIQFHTKAESIHKAVAIASIIARYKFLLEMDKLSKKIDITLPFGASASVDAIGKLIFLKYGDEIFDKIAKKNFKNMKRIIT